MSKLASCQEAFGCVGQKKGSSARGMVENDGSLSGEGSSMLTGEGSSMLMPNILLMFQKSCTTWDV